ncbi:MAG: ATP-binding protein, partial [Bacteroidota bacterium]
EDPLARFIQYYQLSTEESLLVLIVLAPHVLPDFYDTLIAQYLPEGGNFPAFGGVKGEHRRTMLPTGETALFILAGNDVQRRLQLQMLLSNEHFFVKQKILYLDQVKSGEPLMSGKLILDQEYVEMFTLGQISIPKLSTNFPAQYISTELEWQDLVLHEQTLTQIKEIENWVNHHHTLMNDWQMHKKLKAGYRALFYGPPGTGKTLTATLLGKYTQKPVFRIDLSMIVSKYIGETEKNLSNLFDKAQNKDWILFFDEADSIFGKRTNVRDAHDKYANQEVSYLLQRIENYSGLTILASNFKNNIDDAFVRRFQAMIYFPFPKPQERQRLWEKAFPEHIQLEHNVDFQQLAQRYELTGSNIMNVVQYCCIESLAKASTTLNFPAIQQGIARELAKEGKRI